jgi:hypothetical protein
MVETLMYIFVGIMLFAVARSIMFFVARALITLFSTLISLTGTVIVLGGVIVIFAQLLR